MKIKFTTQTSLGGGKIAPAGEVFELPDSQCRELINSNKAEKYVDAPQVAAVEPPAEESEEKKPKKEKKG